jgi:rubrerythrin
LGEPVCLRDAVVDIERAAAAFYRSMAAKKESGSLRDVLAAEEDGHAQALADLLADDGCRGAGERFFEASRPLVLHLAEESQGLDRLAEALAERELILKLALSMEKDAILLYSRMAQTIDDAAVRDCLARIVQEEVRHFDTYFKLLKIVRRSERGPWRSPEEVDRLIREAVAEDRRLYELRKGGA